MIGLKRGTIRMWILFGLAAVMSCILMTGIAAAVQVQEIEAWVPVVTGWERSEETGKLEPYGEPSAINLTTYTGLSGNLSWQLKDPENTGAELDEQGSLTVVPSCTAGTVEVTVSDGTDTETILIKLLRNKACCWGGRIHSPGSKVKAPAAGSDSLKCQYTLSVYDQYGGIVDPEEYQAFWYILPRDDWSVEYTELNGISISQNGLLTVSAGAKACELTIRVRLDCWESQSCQNSLSVYADPTVRWNSPGVLEWDAVAGTDRYVVVLRDEDGELVGSNKTSKTSAEMFSFVGWYMGNESRTYRVLVEARDADNKKIMVMDPGLTVNAEALKESLPHSCTFNDSDRYTLTVKQPIGAGDVLLDTWRTSDGGKNCHRTEFSHAEVLYTSSERQVQGETQEIRLLSDSRVENGTDWKFTLTAAEPRSLEELLGAPAVLERAMEGAPGGVSGSCIISVEKGGNRSAYVILKNAAGNPVETTVILAGYNEDGKLVDCDMRRIVIDGKDTATMLYVDSDDVDRLAVFVLDGDLCALTEKVEVGGLAAG